MKNTILALFIPLLSFGQGRFIKWETDHFKKHPEKVALLDWRSLPKTWDGKTLATWALFAGAGVSHGMREAYHADPYVFERKWGVEHGSFFGADAWKRNYVNNNPELPHKHELFGNVGRDVWHTAGATSKAFYFVGAFSIGARKHPVKYRVFNVLAGFAIQSVFASVTYNQLRR